MNVLHHEGYRSTVEFDAQGDLFPGYLDFFGHLDGVADVVSLRADTVADLRAASVEAVDGRPAQRARIGEEPRRPAPEGEAAALPDATRRAAEPVAARAPTGPAGAA